MDGSHPSLPVDYRRRRFTASDVQTMLDTGVLKDGEKIEFLRGELVEMSPQGPLHADMTQLLLKWIRLHLPRDLDFASQSPLRLGESDEPEPEFFIYPDGLRVNAVRGPDVVLVIEVAFSSLSFDLNVKSALYAEHGVREYWVVDVEGRRTLVHALGADGAYGSPREVPFAAALTAPGGAALVIADLAPGA